MAEFYLDQYLEERTVQTSGETDFFQLCSRVGQAFLIEWEEGNRDLKWVLDTQKKAIIGYENEVRYFKEKIKGLLRSWNMQNAGFPKWYGSIEDGIYNENWGLGGIAQWFSGEYRKSSSAKIIGDRIYFLLDGKMKLMEQKISKERREQLIRAFLLLTPEERLDRDFHEVYLLDGTRITIFGGGMAKTGQDVVVFRRYVVPNFTFEEQAARGTIPEESIPLLKAWVSAGYNLAFTGAVRSSKTTFLSTWQSYEDKSLEGVMVETDPEIPLHKLMPEAPILQLLADGDRMKTISKNLLRSDADYFILAEARDGLALDTAVRIAGKGTRRMKMTFHIREPLDFPHDAAWEIATSCGGDPHGIARRTAKAFDYIFHFVQLKDKSQKRLNGIYEMRYSRDEDKIIIEQICAYDYQSDNWKWSFYMSDEKRQRGMDENYEGFLEFERLLKEICREGG